MSDELLKKVLNKLNEISPPVKIIPVDSSDGESTIEFIPQEDVCYITSYSDRVGYNVMIVTTGGKKYYNNLLLSDLERELGNNPNFLRTKKQYIVNLNNIAKVRINRSRDLWFKGIEQPAINAVSPDNLKEFKSKYAFNVWSGFR